MKDRRPDGDEDRGRRGAFWTTLPGILTGLAAVITALVALFNLLGLGGDGDTSAQRGEPVVAAAPAPSGSAPSAEATGPTADSARTAPAGAGAQGRVTMRSPDDADLELGRVGPGVDGGDLYLYCSAGQCLLNAFGSGGLITTVEGPVDRAGCISALQARQDGVLDSADLATGTWFCVQTDEASIALVQVTSAPGVGTAELVLDYTRWD